MALIDNASLAQQGFPDLDPAAAHFSQDQTWMQQLVLVAKHTPVWLQQLGQRYQRPIERLDEIPDEALAELAERGFTGLWLVGVWRRSPASRKIKQLQGQSWAEASAYAVYAYEIAERLGGTQALDALRQRAANFGIRLAADMVPNHTGIDAPWVVEHPEHYLSRPENPLPDNYSFTGQDLSGDPRVQIILEDHYYDFTDAAVVFKRHDQATGEDHYIYHGNDRVGPPWNDTAQLDFLKAETRKAVIDEIINVSRHFPVVRFDAAMALARRHIQRLWYPVPEEIEAVFTRQQHGFTAEQFNTLMPEEFWREVVERIRAEAPDTMLLAEAFWFMEGYFVHSLGLHRVYNSLFMHTLREERNDDFRKAIKSNLAFDPRLLARYVNFMSTPDEYSALSQFGAGDKYFGVATLLASLPGLPMFSHGQVEGLDERYGMELSGPRLIEQPIPALIDRHQRQIAPLLRRRELFCGLDHFRFYDGHDEQGDLLEDVIAFSNRLGD
jgi:glycosidase